MNVEEGTAQTNHQAQRAKALKLTKLLKLTCL